MKAARIMLVEDERIVALNIRRKLVAMGYEVPACAASGDQALKLMSECCPDIILMDINIEGEIDGIETATRISNDVKVPVIYLTAYSGEETLERARSTKPYGYLLKPFSDRELHATIQMALERHGFERAVEKSEERLRFALEAAEMGVWELDPEDESLSSKGLNLLTKQLTDEIYTGTWHEFIDSVYEPDRMLVDKVLGWTVSDDCLCQVEYRCCKNEEDEPRWYRLIGRAFRQHRAPNRILGVVQDVTEHKNVERLRLDKEAAEKASKFKSEFLASMSHEVRTPLNGVIGMVDLLQRTELNDIQASYAKIIQGSGKTLLAVINEILDFSKIEVGKMTLINQAFDLCDVIEEVVAPFKVSSSDSVTFVSSIAPNTPTCMIGDSIRLKQVIGNLLSNAFKFTEQGKVSLRVEPVTIEKEKVCLTIVVSDTGVGIASEDIDRLFKPFSQIDSTHRRRQGTGLGLVICRRLAQLMQGDIQVESTLGQGSTFSFTALLRWKKDPLLRADLSKLVGFKLLVIDDDPDYRKILSEQAKFLGLDVETAADSEKAIALAQSFKPDLIICDLDMPGESGFDIDRKLTAIPKLKDVPRILLTASASCIPPYHEQLATTGFWGAHVKPIGAPQLKSLLASVLTNQNPVSNEASVPKKPMYEGKVVLVAEDNAINRQVIKAMLRPLGIRVDVAHDGEQARQKFIAGNEAYDLILMDCEMPVLDGYEATRVIRTHEEETGQTRVPIVAFSAHALAEHWERARSVGMDCHLDKPVQMKTLIEVLDQYLGPPHFHTDAD